MALSKKFLVVFLVLSTISLCLAKPRWIWLRDEEKNNEDNNDEIHTREKTGENFMNDLKERNYRSRTGLRAMTTKRCSVAPNCENYGNCCP